jgi:glycine betaine catabolism B
MKIFFEHAENHTDDISSFWFRPERPLRYEAGQFVNVRLAHEHADNRGDARIFTLTSLPSDTLLSILVRFPGESSSYKQALLKLQPGAELSIEEPLGDFVLPKDISIPLVWMAGGIGSAAFVSMAKILAQQKIKRSVTFFQSARNEHELLFDDVWQAAGIAPQQTLTRELKSGKRSARFTADDLFGSAIDRTDETMFYISGPERMVEEMATGLTDKGIRQDYIVREAFTGY